jgi:hypothetical protein
MIEFLKTLGITRDSALFLWGRIVSLAVLVATGVLPLDQLGLPLTDSQKHTVMVVCGLIAYLSGKLATSPLPGKNDAQTVDPSKLSRTGPAVVLALALAAPFVAACHPPATIQSPQARAAYTADQVVQQLGNFQNFVIDSQRAGRVKLDDARDLVTWISGDASANPPVVGLMDTIAADPTNYLAIAAQSWGRWRLRVLNIPALATWVPTLDGFLGVQ